MSIPPSVCSSAGWPSRCPARPAAWRWPAAAASSPPAAPPWSTSKRISWSVTVFTRPSEHSSRKSPGFHCSGKPSASTAGSGPRARVMRLRLGMAAGLLRGQVSPFHHVLHQGVVPADLARCHPRGDEIGPAVAYVADDGPRPPAPAADTRVVPMLSSSGCPAAALADGGVGQPDGRLRRPVACSGRSASVSVQGCR